MTMTYRFDGEGVTTGALEALFAAADLRGRVGDKVRRAFLNSHAVCLAYGGDRLIGAGRAITDGEYHALIHDLAVLPDYQRRGIGQTILGHLMRRLPVWRVMLVADDGVQGFYRKAGFEPYSDVMARLDWNRLYDADENAGTTR
jgi:ribosomal protein S18 acetylase RimI-like enzyme